MGKVKLVAPLSEWQVNAMNQQLHGLVEELEGSRKNPVCIWKETLSLHLYRLIFTWYFKAFLQVLLWLTCVNTHIFKVSLALVPLLLRVWGSLKHSFSSTRPVSWRVTQFTHIIWAMEHVIASRAIFALSLGNLKSSGCHVVTCVAWHVNQGLFNNFSSAVERFSSFGHLTHCP